MSEVNKLKHEIRDLKKLNAELYKEVGRLREIIDDNAWLFDFWEEIKRKLTPQRAKDNQIERIGSEK